MTIPNFEARKISFRFPVRLNLTNQYSHHCEGVNTGDAPFSDKFFGITIHVSGVPVCTALFVGGVEHLESIVR